MKSKMNIKLDVTDVYQIIKGKSASPAEKATEEEGCWLCMGSLADLQPYSLETEAGPQHRG